MVLTHYHTISLKKILNWYSNHSPSLGKRLQWWKNNLFFEKTVSFAQWFMTIATIEAKKSSDSVTWMVRSIFLLLVWCSNAKWSVISSAVNAISMEGDPIVAQQDVSTHSPWFPCLSSMLRWQEFFLFGPLRGLPQHGPLPVYKRRSRIGEQHPTFLKHFLLKLLIRFHFTWFLFQCWGAVY